MESLVVHSMAREAGLQSLVTNSNRVWRNSPGGVDLRIWTGVLTGLSIDIERMACRRVSQRQYLGMIA